MTKRLVLTVLSVEFQRLLGSNFKIIRDLIKLQSVPAVAKFYHSGTSTNMSSYVESMSMGKGSIVIRVDWSSTGSNSMKHQEWRMLPCMNVDIVHLNQNGNTAGIGTRKSTVKKKRSK